MNPFKKAFATGLAAATMSAAPADNVITISKPIRTQGTSVNSHYSRFIDDLVRHEGNRQYQASKGFYRQGRFYPYKDSLGHMTIGYGHKILRGENFSKGITEQEARTILQKDSASAWKSANDLLKRYNVKLNQEQHHAVMQILPNMIFQMGKSGVMGFQNMWSALQQRDFRKASKEMLDSKWAKKDSPNRAKELANKMKMIYN